MKGNKIMQRGQNKKSGIHKFRGLLFGLLILIVAVRGGIRFIVLAFAGPVLLICPHYQFVQIYQMQI